MKFDEIMNEDYENYYDTNLLKTSGMKPLVDAITNRRPITFMYTGPAKGKESVLRGKRINVEPVALGTTNKNKLAIRAWVPGGNPSKKGLETNQWRTFLLSRMSNIKIDLDKNYEGPKNGFNPDEKKGSPYWPLNKIYVSTDFSAEPKKPRKARKPVVKTKLKKEPVPVEPEVEPEVIPVEPGMEPTTPPVEPTTTEPTSTEPTAPETEPVQTTEPVEPAAAELPQPKAKAKPSKIPPRTTTVEPTVEPETPETEKPEEDETNGQLSESIKRIKRLMFL